MQSEVFIGPVRISRQTTRMRTTPAESCHEKAAGIDERIAELAAKAEAGVPLFAPGDRNTAEERGEVVAE